MEDGRQDGLAGGGSIGRGSALQGRERRPVVGLLARVRRRDRPRGRPTPSGRGGGSDKGGMVCHRWFQKVVRVDDGCGEVG